VHRLADPLGLHLAILLRRREPGDVDRHVLLRRQLLRRRLGAGARGEEDRVVGALPDHGDGELLRAGSGGGAARRGPGGVRGLVTSLRAGGGQAQREDESFLHQMSPYLSRVVVVVPQERWPVCSCGGTVMRRTSAVPARATGV